MGAIDVDVFFGCCLCITHGRFFNGPTDDGGFSQAEEEVTRD